MARIDWVEQRLREWAQYVSTGSDGSGYAAINVLHESWMPPTPGQTPTMKVGAGSAARGTHRAVGMLSIRLANTLLVHYCMNLPIADQAARLECSEVTVYARVEVAHRRLA